MRRERTAPRSASSRRFAWLCTLSIRTQRTSAPSIRRISNKWRAGSLVRSPGYVGGKILSPGPVPVANLVRLASDGEMGNATVRCGTFRLIWWALVGRLRPRAALEAENLVLRQQINVLRRMARKRPRFGGIDRLIFVGLYRFFPDVLDALAIVQPDTVIRWHSAGVQSVLAVGIQTPRGKAEGVAGDAPVDP